MLLLLLGVALLGLALVLALKAILHDHLQGEAIVARVGVYTGATPAAKTKSGLVDLLVDGAGRRFGGRFDAGEARGQIAAAGLYSLTPQRLFGYRVLALIALPGAVVLLGLAGTLSPLLAVIAAVLAVAVAWRLPAIHLKRRADERTAQIDRELPVLVDLLVVTVEAGVGLGASLQLTADEVRGPLRDELRLAVKEQQMGLTTYEALKNLQRRCPTPATTAFVRALVQGEQLGVSIGKIMRDLAVDMRSRRRAAAEERAQQAPVKMLFPLVLLIFPAMLAVLLAPGLLEFLRAMG